MKKFSAKTLIALNKWKMLLMTLEEGEHTFRMPRKKQECLRMTIYRTNYDRHDKEYIYDCCYKGDIIVVTKTRKEQS